MHEIHFVCSFFSAARRTNQEAPPRLSGFWVRRYGRRRGLRNSLRSDSPRPFSSVSSPLRLRRPIKAESGIVAFACILTPSVLLTPPSFGHLPYILLCKTPRNATGHGKGRVGDLILLLPMFFQPPPFFSTPSPYGHSPYIPYGNTGGED